jgi:hypothetical protein
MRRPTEDHVHTWFELTYANYLVLPRTLLQSMPDWWQAEFVKMLETLREGFAHLEHAPGYSVQARGAGGRFIKDPTPHYNRGRTYLEPAMHAKSCRLRSGEQDTPDTKQCGLCEAGPKPPDYEWPVGSGQWNTHYINHGNTWQSMRRP